MTSKIDALKTNELIRRRKLRLQQVREQSKDIAKKIRQRAKVEKLKQIVELDAKKQKEYFQRQKQLVGKLEEYYAKGIENVGAGHKSASQVKLQENQTKKVDPSKQRGKDAAAELRKKRQEKLDEQKKLLDRKLQAREVANEVSREKSAAVGDKMLTLLTKASSKDVDAQSKDGVPNSNKDSNGGDGSEVKCNDMATQWDLEPNEWEPSIPELSLPKDDKDSVKETNNNVESRSDKSKRLDLFALSDEMPSSLRGGLSTQERVHVKPSLTLVSEYLQSRGLRLREPDIAESSKKSINELHRLKNTILRTRASKEGTACVCQVHDEEMVPVPTWRAEYNCKFCSNCIPQQHQFRQTRTCSSMHVNNVFSSVTPLHPDLLPSPVLRGKTLLRRNRIPLKSFTAKANVADKARKSNAFDSAVPKKSSVTMYNHSTRNVRDIPCDERFVVRDLQMDDDAYSQAMKETATDYNIEKDHQKKVQEIRSKVAMTKQNVEKEYRDTVSFLNSLPKDMGNKPIRRAYMDEDRQQSLRDSRQQKFQQEYKKIVKDCKKNTCRNKTRSYSETPPKSNNDFDSTDFQYSWMPIPEGDGNLAIHTIPTSLREGKSGNTVKFSKVDSYHEYRSRHKHTPPTKDTTHQPKRHVEAVLIQNSSDSESVSSETSSIEHIRLEKKDKTSKDTEKLSDVESIIVYKILGSKKKIKKSSKIMKDIAKSLTLLENQNTTNIKEIHTVESNTKKTSRDSDRQISFDELNEGLYKAVNKNVTGDNIISSMFYAKDGERIEVTEDDIKSGRPCCCSKTLSKDQQQEKGTSLRWESENPPQTQSASNPCVECKCGCKNRRQPKNTDQQSARRPSATTSTSSFKTATSNKSNIALPDGGFMKLIDEGGEEAAKFFIGTSGFLRDDAYEVVIQLRKKGDEKHVRELPTELTKINQEDLRNKVLVETTEVLTEFTKINQEDLKNKVSVETREINTPLETVEASTARSISNASKKLKKSNMNSEIQNFDVNVASVPINRNVEHVSSNNEDVNSQLNVKDVSEKDVSASFQDAIPIHIPKSDSNIRPATSTYTQTSMSSPNHRPVFFHMSSSTSTAYMSPPEMILPKFLIQDHRMSDDDFYDPRNFEMQDKIEMTDEHEYCEDYECKCRKCRHARKITWCRTNAHRCKKPKHKAGQTETPPNTARGDLDIAVTDSNSSRENCQCRKCRSLYRLDKPTSLNIHVNRNKGIAATKHSSQNLIMRGTTSSVSTNKDEHKRRNKSSLNPIIRDYVNKLLALNKESLKAVQVVDQDCSSVATPGSSIINVPHNSDDKIPAIENKISLEQIKTMLKQKIIDECKKKTNNSNLIYSDVCTKDNFNQNAKLSKATRRKTVHKVKSLNISKHLLRTKKAAENKQPLTKQMSSSSSTKGHVKIPPCPRINKVRSKSSPTPRMEPINLVMRSKTSTNLPNDKTSNSNFKECIVEPRRNTVFPGFSCHRATTTSTSPNSETTAPRQKANNHETPSNMSTQTSINVDSEINFLRFDEDKIQNMEKIADLTEKCTIRLSNLAKVLEEVRRNKSLAYSQISTSDTASDSDQKSDRNANKISANEYKSFHDTQKSLEPKSPDTFAPVEELNDNGNKQNSYVPFLNDIPKPDSFKTPTLELNISSSLSNKSNPSSPSSENYEYHLKSRGKPPPALSRIHLKHLEDYVIPHELSTVVEVDSPMSVKLKTQVSRNETRLDVPDSSNRDNGSYNANRQNEGRTTANLDLLVSNVDVPEQTKIMNTESSNDSKIKMIDMNQFNEIMLKPFFSLQEYAKHHNVGALDDGSNVEDFVKGDMINDELSSLHSDGSLPDVISELLKRNIISEPFKFDTGSNVNSTTISSESTLSVLALSKVRKEKKKSSVMFQNKENIGETSDTLSVSSNPDLENAFKRLGMGWASSTLKKTKERLALSSSSNTSSTSLSQFKIKNLNKDIPVLVSDTVSSVLNLSNRPQHKRYAADTSKNAEQQTSLTNSMTVKEFLTNELSNKITFHNKSRNDTEDEFVSLFETKMPEEMNHASRMVREDSVDNSMRSATNNRARTSTPVQLFKSTTYQSSSSSNLSNGLFSNADDLSSVKQTSNSMKHSTSDKDDLTIPSFSLRIKKGSSECSKSD